MAIHKRPIAEEVDRIYKKWNTSNELTYEEVMRDLGEFAIGLCSDLSVATGPKPMHKQGAVFVHLTEQAAQILSLPSVIEKTTFMHQVVEIIKKTVGQI